MRSLRGPSSQRQTRVGGERASENSGAESHAVADRLAESSQLSPSGKQVTLEELVSDAHVPMEACTLPMARGALQLSGMGITSLQDVEQHWQACRTLSLSGNEVATIEHLPLTVEDLDLSRNRITSMRGLSGLRNLRLLNLSHNNITKISGLEHASLLLQLNLACNQIRFAIHLEALKELEQLDIAYNRIGSFSALRTLSLNTALHSINLVGNPVAAKDAFRLSLMHIVPQLQMIDNTPAPVSHAPAAGAAAVPAKPAFSTPSRPASASGRSPWMEHASFSRSEYKQPISLTLGMVGGGPAGGYMLSALRRGSSSQRGGEAAGKSKRYSSPTISSQKKLQRELNASLLSAADRTLDSSSPIASPLLSHIVADAPSAYAEKSPSKALRTRRRVRTPHKVGAFLSSLEAKIGELYECHMAEMELVSKQVCACACVYPHATRRTRCSSARRRTRSAR